MKGILLLSEGRTGSSWLMHRSNETDVLGKGDEWFRRDIADDRLANISDGGTFLGALADAAKTPNGVFMTKIFPTHHRAFRKKYGFDAIRHLANTHDVLCVLLERKDKLGQAISHVRARQTGAWASVMAEKTEPQYSFDEILHFYLRAHKSSEYWRMYAGISGLNTVSLCYEDALPDGAPYLDALFSFCDIAPVPVSDPPVKIQRDTLTEDWRRQFLEDAGKADLVSHLMGGKTALSRFRRFIEGSLPKWRQNRNDTK